MLTLVYDYIEEEVIGNEVFESIDNSEDIETQVKNGDAQIEVHYTVMSDDGDEHMKIIIINLFEVMAFVYKKVQKITPDKYAD